MGITDKFIILLAVSVLVIAEPPLGYDYNKPINDVPAGHYDPSNFNVDVELQTLNLIPEINFEPNPAVFPINKPQISPIIVPSLEYTPSNLQHVEDIAPVVEIAKFAPPIQNVGSNQHFSLPSLVPPVNFAGRFSGPELGHELVGQIENIVLNEEVRSQQSFEPSESRVSSSITSTQNKLVKVILGSPQRSLSVIEYVLDEKEPLVDNIEIFDAKSSLQKPIAQTRLQIDPIPNIPHQQIVPQIQPVPQKDFNFGLEVQQHGVELLNESTSPHQTQVLEQHSQLFHQQNIETIQHEVHSLPNIPVIAKQTQQFPIHGNNEFKTYGPPH